MSLSGDETHSLLFNRQECHRELRRLAPEAPLEKIEKVLSCAFAISTNESANLGLPDFPKDNLPHAAKMLEQNPQLSPYEVLVKLYPYKLFLKEQTSHLEALLDGFGVAPEQGFISSFTKKLRSFLEAPRSSKIYIETEYQNRLIEEMLQSESVADFCLVGPKGCGKSILVQQLADILGKQTENIVLYQDMTARDLIQQRTTLDNGDTTWKLSPLVEAALEGKIAVLDGINRIHPSTLSVLHRYKHLIGRSGTDRRCFRLVQDRELQLHDGQRLMSTERYQFLKNNFNLSDDQLKASGLLAIHPDFRIIAIGEPPSFQTSSGNWMSPEVLSLFLFHEVRTLSKEEELHIITSNVRREQFGWAVYERSFSVRCCVQSFAQNGGTGSYSAQQ
jgi:nicotinamide riboside kinase